MRTRTLVLLLALGLMLVGCQDDSLTSTTEPETSPSIGPTTTLDPNQPVCFYLGGYVAVPTADQGLVPAELGDPVSASEIIGETSGLAEGVDDAAYDAIDSKIAESVLFFSTGGDTPFDIDDPYDLAEALRASNGDLQASPIHVTGFMGHIHYQPGTDPEPVSGLELPDVTVALDGDMVAVVDSGIMAPATEPDPFWFFGPPFVEGEDDQRFILFDNPTDIEDFETGENASHGTFVSGLIRQIAPSKRVTFAAARPIDHATAIPRGEGALPVGASLSSEIQVAEAIARLMLRHPNESGATMKALNLSLGGYACNPTLDDDLLATNQMVQAWLGTYQGSTVLAAAGNEGHMGPAFGVESGEYVPFYPAALSSSYAEVRAVSASSLDYQEVVWDSNGQVVELNASRPWVTDWAPGTNLVNLSGIPQEGGPPELVCWSGSSFATAVASARVAANQQVSSDYQQITGLTFVQPNASSPSSEAVTVVDGSTESIESSEVEAGCGPTQDN